MLKDYTRYIPKAGRVELDENDRFAVIKAGISSILLISPTGA